MGRDEGHRVIRMYIRTRTCKLDIHTFLIALVILVTKVSK